MPVGPVANSHPMHLSQSTPSVSQCKSLPGQPGEISVALLTGGTDRPYVYGLVKALQEHGVVLDFVGSDDLDFPDLTIAPGIRFLNLRGSQKADVSLKEKAVRVLRYYFRLVRYACKAKPEIFHILWNNKFEVLDRTVLMLFYKLLGKQIALTTHNVNAGIRDNNDGLINRLTLKIQYRLSNHLFVHTEKMKLEMVKHFGVPAERVTVIPFGINNVVPNTELDSRDARGRLGIAPDEKVLLFFGHITAYKGLEYLISAFQQLVQRDPLYRLVIAGRPNQSESYWPELEREIHASVDPGRVLLRTEHIPDEETEAYFKAADVMVLPYKHVYQSGVMFLGYSFGLPVVAADVGCLREDIIEGTTGFLFEPHSVNSLVTVLEKYFGSQVHSGLKACRPKIRAYAAERHSWNTVAEITKNVYRLLLSSTPAQQLSEHDRHGISLDVTANS